MQPVPGDLVIILTSEEAEALLKSLAVLTTSSRSSDAKALKAIQEKLKGRAKSTLAEQPLHILIGHAPLYSRRSGTVASKILLTTATQPTVGEYKRSKGR